MDNKQWFVGKIVNGHVIPESKLFDDYESAKFFYDNIELNIHYYIFETVYG